MYRREPISIFTEENQFPFSEESQFPFYKRKPVSTSIGKPVSISIRKSVSILEWKISFHFYIEKPVSIFTKESQLPFSQESQFPFYRKNPISIFIEESQFSNFIRKVSSHKKPDLNSLGQPVSIRKLFPNSYRKISFTRKPVSKFMCESQFPLEKPVYIRNPAPNP